MVKRGLLVAGAVAVSSVALVSGIKAWQGTENRDEQVVELAPVTYPSFESAQAANDATMLVTIVSSDGRYVDFGLDGKPNFGGDPGAGIEYFTAHVDDVISGDESLVEQSIVVTQLESGTVSEVEVGDQFEPGQSYVIIASSYEPNPGTIDSEVWSTTLAEQGVFPVIEGEVFPTSPDLFPEVFDGNSVSLEVLENE
ncbi:hypothetical protein [Flaviflexus massiliensis]|uniref:hypothetical protein n=1 Tax=Flaviflexus massiliensis TaxID=1522309 RepID=UPI0006D535B8|nr:hypothetical protein [Flaviflexus massiliensis]